MTAQLRDFLELPYDQLEELNLQAKAQRLGHMLHHQGLALDEEMIHEERLRDQLPDPDA